MDRSKRLWIGLAFLSGTFMALVALASARSGVVFLRKFQLALQEHKAVPFMAWVGLIVLLSAVGASLSLLLGTVAASAGRIRIGSHSLVIGSIFQWLFAVSGLAFHWALAANRRIGNISPFMMIFFVIAVIVSIAAINLRQRVRTSDAAKLKPLAL